MSIEIRHGTTRIVFLTRNYAFKIPTVVEWRLFLHGLLGNLQERRFHAMHSQYLMPVLFSLPGGWLVVMPRGEDLTREEYDAFESAMWNEEVLSSLWDEQLDFFLPAEKKLDSWKRYQGRIVAVDYG